jgi:hypothetical protein
MNPLLAFMAIIDLVAAISLMFIPAFPVRFAYVCVIYLVLKGFLFFGDIASKIDLVIGIYLLLSALFGFHNILNYIMAVYLIQKAVFSFFTF